MTNPIVDLWSTDLDAIDSDDRVLHPTEKDRSSHFKIERDRRRYVAGRGWLRSVLARYAGEPAERLRLVLGEFGKPFLTFPDTDLEFSLAHSGPLALLAVTHHRPIGIDVEVVRPGAYDPPSASLVMTPIEREFIESSSDPNVAFLRCWTRKEAYAKVGGRGLERDLSEVTLTGLDGQGLRIDGYKVVDFPVDRALAAVAVPIDHEIRTR